MRRQLVFSTLAVAVTVMLLLGIPLAIASNRLIHEEAQQALEREASAILAGVQFSLESRQPVTVQQISHEYPDRYIQITLPDETVISAGSPIPKNTPILSDQRFASGIHVEVAQRAADVEADALRSLLLICSLMALAIAVAVGLAIVQSRKLTLPLIDLAETADRLGSGNARPRRRRYGIPEVDRVAEVLDRSAVRLADLLAASREFASDASHQLRTPLTALTMRLEEMVEAADYPDVVREEGAAALAQTERLVAVVEQLLARARHDRTGLAEPIRVDEILLQQLEEWQPIFNRDSRMIRMTGESELVALVTPAGLSQIVATLLDNSLVHGSGTVTLHTKLTAASIVIEVSDEGAGVPVELERRVFERSISGGKGTGLGLYLARSLATVDGGRLELVRPRPATFAIFLRKATEAELANARVIAGPA